MAILYRRIVDCMGDSIKYTLRLNCDLKLASITMALGLFFMAGLNLKAQEVTQYYRTPTAQFIQNDGQWDSELLYQADIIAGQLRLYQDYILVTLLNEDDIQAINTLFHDESEWAKEALDNYAQRYHNYQIRFANSNPSVQIFGEDVMESYNNYFIGNDPEKWASEVPIFKGVRYANLWEGIDLVLKETNGKLKYDLIVQPGADVTQIQLDYIGQDGLALVDEELKIRTSIREITESKPVVYQQINDERIPVKAAYRLIGNRVSFTFPQGFDSKHPLVIDPQVQIIFSTYSGSNASNWGHTATYNSNGKLYGGGIVSGAGYQVTPGVVSSSFNGGAWDFGISAYGPNVHYFSTYIGGNGDDRPHSLIVDNTGNLVILGSTTSTNFPIPNPMDAHDDSFNGDFDVVLAKINSSGTSLLAATYFGGNSVDARHNGNLFYNYSDDKRGEVMVDNLNKIYIATVTESSNIIPSSGSYSGQADALIAKFSSNLTSTEWVTMIGGSGDDQAYSVKITDDNEVIVCGGTESAGLATTAGVIQESYKGNIDGFIANLDNNTGAINALTYMGTPFYDQAFFTEIGPEGAVYVLGSTKGSFGNAIPADAYIDFAGSQFVLKTNTNLTDKLVLTKFGSGAPSLINLSLTAFMVDTCRNIYVSGWGGGLAGGTTISGLPLSNDDVPGLEPFDVDNNGGNFWFGIWAPNMDKLLFGSYFGSSGSIRPHVDGGTSRFDQEGYIYQGICACGANLQEPPIVAPAFSTNNAGCNLATVKIFFDVGRVDAEGGAEPNAIGCAPFDVNFTSESNGVDFIWDFGDGSPVSTEENPFHTYADTGVYDVTFIAIDSALCIPTDTAYLEVIILTTPTVQDITVFDNCDSVSVFVENDFVTQPDWLIYNWDMGDGTIYDTTSILHYYENPGTYQVTFTVSDTVCNYDSIYTQEVIIPETLESSFQILDSIFVPLNSESLCVPAILNFFNSVPGVNYQWDFGDGSEISNEFQPQHEYSSIGEFLIELIVTDSASCNISDTSYQNVLINPINPLVADFDFIANCEDSLVTFFNTGTTGLPEDFGGYTWYFGDGITGVGDTVYHEYSDNGMYVVSLAVNDTIVCTIADSVAMELNVQTSLNINAQFVYQTDCEDLSVSVLNTGSQYEASEYIWYMGDGSTYENQSAVQHTYEEPGYYSIFFYVTDPFCDKVDSIIQEVFIEPTIQASFVTDTGGCSPFTNVLFNTSQIGYNTYYFWDFGNQKESTDANPEVIYDVEEEESYLIELVIVDSLSCNLTDTMEIPFLASPIIDIDLEPYYKLCEDSFIVVDAGNPGSDYLWSTGSTTQQIEIFDQGDYYIVAQNAYCSDSAAFYVEFTPHPSLDYETAICPEPALVLTTLPNSSAITWSTGETTPSIEVSTTGKYWNHYLDSNLCWRHDTIRVEVIDDTDRIFAANSFTPNGDGINDTWQVYGGSENDFKVQIFDRWGKMVWESTDINQPWNGDIDGKASKQEMYVYRVYFYSECYQKTIDTHGTILLLR